MTLDPALAAKNRKVTRTLIGIVVGMFTFGWASVPFYNLLCRELGIGPVGAAPAQAGIIPTTDERYVTVKFLSQVNAGLDASFGSSAPSMRLKVGEPQTVDWWFHNHSDKPVELQAIYSVAPDKAGPHLDKIECFCFDRMTLAAGQKLTMPVTLRVDPELPKRYQEMTLAYTLYALNPDVNLIRQGQAKSIAIHDQAKREAAGRPTKDEP